METKVELVPDPASKEVREVPLSPGDTSSEAPTVAGIAKPGEAEEVEVPVVERVPVNDEPHEAA